MGEVPEEVEQHIPYLHNTYGLYKYYYFTLCAKVPEKWDDKNRIHTRTNVDKGIALYVVRRKIE